MSAPKKLNVGPPPPRINSSIPTKPRTRSRSANPPSHHSTSSDIKRSKSQYRGNDKPKPPKRAKSRGVPINKTKKLPKPSKKPKPVPIKFKNKHSPTNSPYSSNSQYSPKKNNSSNSPYSPNSSKFRRKKTNNNKNYKNKELPPSRTRAKTAAPQSPPSVASTPNKNDITQIHQLPSIGFGDGGNHNGFGIDDRPSLKPRNVSNNKNNEIKTKTKPPKSKSTKTKPTKPPKSKPPRSKSTKTKPPKVRKRGSKIQKKPLPPNSKKSTKNVIVPTQIQEEKELNMELNPISPIITSSNSNKKGHRREYSVVKSVPLIFKTSSFEESSPKTTQNTRQFGLRSPTRNKKGFAAFSDKRNGLIHGSCQCGGIEYELLSLPQELQHCYCSMCRKMHGSAVATWTPMLESDIRFIKKGKQTAYKSSDKVSRSFCSVCGSNISLKYIFQNDTIWITPSLFNGVTKQSMDNIEAKTWWLNVRVLHIFCASKCEWYDIPNDGHPQLSEIDIEKSEINDEPRFVYNKKLPAKPSKN